MMAYFNRETFLKIEKFDYSEFKVDWEYNIGLEESVAELTLTLFNLSKTSIERLKKGNVIEFGFGYDSEIVGFFYGTVDSYTVENGITKTITIKAYEYSKSVFKKISRSYLKGTKASYVINDIADQCRFNLKRLELKKDTVYKGGYNIYDLPLIALKKIATSCGSKFKVDGDNVYIFSKNDGMNQGIEFNFDSGLLTDVNTIQSSVATDIEEDDDTESRKEGYAKSSANYNVTTLANPNVKKFDLIKVLGTIYRVDSIKINDWKTEMEVKEVDG